MLEGNWMLQQSCQNELGLIEGREGGRQMKRSQQPRKRGTASLWVWNN